MGAHVQERPIVCRLARVCDSWRRHCRRGASTALVLWVCRVVGGCGCVSSACRAGRDAMAGASAKQAHSNTTQQ